MGVRSHFGPVGSMLACALIVVAVHPAPSVAAVDDAPPVSMIRTVPRPGRVAVTFDDGPNPTWTPVVLDILDEYQVRATFFVNGFRVLAYPEVAAEVVRRGHSLQNHGYGHQHMTDLGDGAATREVTRGAETIFEATGAVSTCFRPGWGLNSARTRRLTAEAGEATVLWTVDSADYAHQSGTGSIREVLTDLQAGDVILMHDSIGWAARDALPVIIAEVRARGLEFDTICDDRPVLVPFPPSAWGPPRGSTRG